MGPRSWETVFVSDDTVQDEEKGSPEMTLAFRLEVRPISSLSDSRIASPYKISSESLLKRMRCDQGGEAML